MAEPDIGEEVAINTSFDSYRCEWVTEACFKFESTLYKERQTMNDKYTKNTQK